MLCDERIILIPYIPRQYRTHLTAHFFIDFFVEKELLQIARVPIAYVRTEYTYSPEHVLFVLPLPVYYVALQLPDGQLSGLRPRLRSETHSGRKDRVQKFGAVAGNGKTIAV